MTITIEVQAIFLIFYSSKQEEGSDSITTGQSLQCLNIYIKEFYVLGSLELLQTFCVFIKENDRTW